MGRYLLCAGLYGFRVGGCNGNVFLPVFPSLVGAKDGVSEVF